MEQSVHLGKQQHLLRLQRRTLVIAAGGNARTTRRPGHFKHKDSPKFPYDPQPHRVIPKPWSKVEYEKQSNDAQRYRQRRRLSKKWPKPPEFPPTAEEFELQKAEELKAKVKFYRNHSIPDFDIMPQPDGSVVITDEMVETAQDLWEQGNEFLKVHAYQFNIGIEEWEETEAEVTRRKLQSTKQLAKDFEEATNSEIPYLLDDTEETDEEAASYEPRPLFAGFKCIYMPSYKYFYVWKPLVQPLTNENPRTPVAYARQMKEWEAWQPDMSKIVRPGKKIYDRTYVRAGNRGLIIGYTNAKGEFHRFGWHEIVGKRR